MNIKKFRIFILSLVFLSPITTLAHVKWFAEAQMPVRNYQITDSPVILAIVISVLIILLGIYLEKKLKVPNKLNKYIEAWAPKVLSLASIGFGLAFIIFSIQGFIFAPNLQVASPLGTCPSWWCPFPRASRRPQRCTRVLPCKERRLGARDSPCLRRQSRSPRL